MSGQKTAKQRACKKQVDDRRLQFDEQIVCQPHRQTAENHDKNRSDERHDGYPAEDQPRGDNGDQGGSHENFGSEINSIPRVGNEKDHQRSYFQRQLEELTADIFRRLRVAVVVIVHF